MTDRMRGADEIGAIDWKLWEWIDVTSIDDEERKCLQGDPTDMRPYPARGW
jgi:hypothetical protein